MTYLAGKSECAKAMLLARRMLELDPNVAQSHLNNVHDDPVLKEARFQNLFKKIDTIARSR